MPRNVADDEDYKTDDEEDDDEEEDDDDDAGDDESEESSSGDDEESTSGGKKRASPTSVSVQMKKASTKRVDYHFYDARLQPPFPMPSQDDGPEVARKLLEASRHQALVKKVLVPILAAAMVHSLGANVKKTKELLKSAIPAYYLMARQAKERVGWFGRSVMASSPLKRLRDALEKADNVELLPFLSVKPKLEADGKVAVKLLSAKQLWSLGMKTLNAAKKHEGKWKSSSVFANADTLELKSGVSSLEAVVREIELDAWREEKASRAAQRKRNGDPTDAELMAAYADGELGDVEAPDPSFTNSSLLLFLLIGPFSQAPPYNDKAVENSTTMAAQVAVSGVGASRREVKERERGAALVSGLLKVAETKSGGFAKVALSVDRLSATNALMAQLDTVTIELTAVPSSTQFLLSIALTKEEKDAIISSARAKMTSLQARKDALEAEIRSFGEGAQKQVAAATATLAASSASAPSNSSQIISSQESRPDSSASNRNGRDSAPVTDVGSSSEKTRKKSKTAEQPASSKKESQKKRRKSGQQLALTDESSNRGVWEGSAPRYGMSGGEAAAYGGGMGVHQQQFRGADLMTWPHAAQHSYSPPPVHAFVPYDAAAAQVVSPHDTGIGSGFRPFGAGPAAQGQGQAYAGHLPAGQPHLGHQSHAML